MGEILLIATIPFSLSIWKDENIGFPIASMCEIYFFKDKLEAGLVDTGVFVVWGKNPVEFKEKLRDGKNK